MENNLPDQTQQQSPVVAQQPTSFDPTKHGKSKKIIIGAVAILIVLIIIFGLFFVFNNSSSVVPTVTPGVKEPIITPAPTIPIQSPIKMTLTKGKIVIIPTTSVTIEYVGASLPNPKCFDCVTTTDIALVKDDIRKLLNYSCGGIAGNCTNKFTEYQMEITLENSTETTAQVTIKKQ